MTYFKYFTIREFTKHNSCKELTQLISDNALFDNLVSCMHTASLIRNILGSPVIISSCYRDPDHNKREKGSPSSQHLTASAFDIHLTPDQRRKFILNIDDIRVLNIGQLIEYSWGFHIGLSHANNEKVRTFLYINKLKS